MRAYQSISFDDTGFAPQGERNGARVWFTDAGDGIGLFYFDQPPDIGADINSIVGVRKFYRNSAAALGLGLIEAETPQIDGCVSVRAIFKSPQRPTGMTYVGSLTLPFRDFSYVVKVQCAEQGTTGIREAVVLDAMLRSGQVKVSGASDGKIRGWMRDPYDPTVDAPLMPNLAEDEQYDGQFPNHPLSRVRSVLRQVQSSLRLAPEVKNAPPFIFAERQVKTLTPE